MFYSFIYFLIKTSSKLLPVALKRYFWFNKKEVCFTYYNIRFISAWPTRCDRILRTCFKKPLQANGTKTYKKVPKMRTTRVTIAFLCAFDTSSQTKNESLCTFDLVSRAFRSPRSYLFKVIFQKSTYDVRLKCIWIGNLA